MKLRIYISLLAMFLCVACKNGENNEHLSRMDAIKAMGDSCPEEALRKLAIVGTQLENESEYIRNKYSLLEIRLKDKAYITHTTDSVIKKVCKCFEENGSQRDLQEAYYYMGSVYRDLNDSPRAVTYFNKSAQLAEDNSNADYEILICTYSQLAVLYKQQFNCNEALRTILKGLDIAYKIGDSDERTIMNVASAYEAVNDSISSILFCDKAYEMIQKNGINAENADIVARLMSCYALHGFNEKAHSCYALLSQIPKCDRPGNYNINLAKYYEQCVSVDSAASIMLNILDENNRLESVYNASRWLTKYYIAQKKYDSAATYAINFINANEKVIKKRKFEQTANANNIFKYSRDVEEEKKMIENSKKYQSYLFFAILTTVTLLLVMFILFYLNKRRALLVILSKESALKNADSLIHKLEQDLQNEQEDIANKRKELEERMANNVLLSKQLENSEEKYKELLIQNRELIKLSMLKKFSGNAKEIIDKCIDVTKGKAHFNEEDWEELLGAVNEMYPDFILDVQQKFKGIKEPMLRVCCCWKIGLSNPQIVKLTGYPPQTVFDRIKRIEKVMGW